MGAEFMRQVLALRQSDGHAGLRGARKSVLAIIAFHSNHSSLYCSLKYGTIAEELGVSVSSVDKAIKWLEAEGYLTRGKRLRRKDGTLGSYTFKLRPLGIVPAGPPGNTAENHPEYFRRKNHKDEPTASSTKAKTAEGEEAGDLKEGTAERQRATGSPLVGKSRPGPLDDNGIGDDGGGPFVSREQMAADLAALKFGEVSS